MKYRRFPRALVLPLIALALAASALLVSPRSSGQERRRVREDVARVLTNFDELSFDTAALMRDVRKRGRLALSTARDTFELKLEPFDIRADNYRAVAAGADGSTTELARAPARWFRGEVEGVEGSRVRLTLDEDTFEGVIVTPTETYFVESARNFSASARASEFVLYAASSLKPSVAGGECGTTLAERVGTEAARHAQTSAKRPTTEGVFAPKPEAEVATESDFEYTQSFGGNPDAANQDILNTIAQVDAIYDAQLGVRLRVVFQRAWTANNDPYTLTAAGEAVSQLANVYAGSFAPDAPPARDVTHMFTGKDFDGSTIGIAYLGVACNAPDFAYGISQSKFSTLAVQRIALTAHELGHNFGATHPNQESPTPSSCVLPAFEGGNIMNSFIQSTSKFCPFSLDQMSAHVMTVGECLTRLTQPGCNYSLTSNAQLFAATGGTGSVGVSTAGPCQWGLAEGTDWIDSNAPAANGPGSVFYTVKPNTAAGPREATIDVAQQLLTVRQAASSACSSTHVAVGQTAPGSLDVTDCRSGQPARPSALADLYTFSGRAGQLVKIEMNANVTGALDTYLYLFAPDGSLVAENDDVGSSVNSRIPLSGFFTLTQTGVYTVEATSFGTNVTTPAGYTVTLTDNAPTGSVSFAGDAPTVSETLGAGGLGADGAGFRVVTVTRGGDTSGTATVDFATSDGTAEQRKDYEQTLGTLVFGPGETTKTFTVFVDDDAHGEGAETVNLTLSNPKGVTLGAVSATTLTINSNDGASGPSPVRVDSFDTAFFVRQQYLDFFGREPDAPGFAFWQQQINECGANAQCAELRRINVSGAFFLSIEFQETGGLVERMYKASFGDRVEASTGLVVPVIRLNEFLADTQRIGQGVIVGQGTWQQRLEANKQAFALEFVLRQRFINSYPLTLTPAQFVDNLNTNSGSALSQAERDQLVSQLTVNNTAAGRAAVLRAVAEDADLEHAEKTRAFVLMQYYGYLRRNPDDAPERDRNFAGWKFWLDKLEESNGNFVAAEMVRSFLVSDEYIKRFGQ